VSFKRYMAMEVLFVLLVVSLSPLWVPVWLVWSIRDWYWDCRYTWESMERDRRRADDAGGGRS
jgi:hypothetical protein